MCCKPTSGVSSAVGNVVVHIAYYGSSHSYRAPTCSGSGALAMFSVLPSRKSLHALPRQLLSVYENRLLSAGPTFPGCCKAYIRTCSVMQCVKDLPGMYNLLTELPALGSAGCTKHTTK